MAEYKISASLDANTQGFKRAIDSASRVLKSFKREAESTKDVKIDGDISPLQRAIQNAKRVIASIRNDKAEAKITVDDSAVNNRIRAFKAMLRSIPNKIRTRVVVDYDKNVFDSMKKGWDNVQRASENYQNKMDQIANSIRTFGTVIGNQIKGGLISSFSAVIPIVASLVPAIMAVGNATVVAGGGALGLMGAFQLAKAGAYAFGGMAMTALKMVENGTMSSSKALTNYQNSLDSLKKSWQELVKSNSTSIFTAMSNGLKTVQSAMTSLQPYFKGIADGVKTASTSMLNWVQTSNIAKSAFNMLNTSGVTVFKNMLSGAGRFGAGLLSIFTQLAPLFTWVSQGFATMGQKFLEFSQKASTAQGIKDFINYTKENLPALGKIFTNTFNGLFNLFKAFAPNSATLMQSLAQMSAKFAEWSSGIAKSDGFQKFIQYVQTNGPTILGLIGSLVTLIINVATAMAPLGQAVLQIITGFTQWLSKMTETHPIIGMLLGVLVTLGGILMAIIPTIISITSFFLPLIGAMLGLGTEAGALTVIMELVGVVIGGLSAPILAIIAVVAALVAAFIYLWNTNEGFRQAVINIWNMIWQTIMSVVNAIVKFVMQIWGMLVTWWQQNNQLILQTIQTIWNLIGPIIMAAIQIVLGIVQTGWALIKTATEIAWNLIKAVVQIAITLLGGIIRTVMQIINGDWTGAWNTIKATAIAIWNIIKSTAMAIWNALKAGLIAILNGLKTSVTGIWNAIKAIITAVMNVIKSVVTSIWNAIKAVVMAVVNAIKAVVTAGFNAIRSIATSVMNAIRSVITAGWNAIKSAFTSAMNAIRSAVTNGMNNVKSAVRSGIQGAVSAAKSFVGEMMSAGRQLIMGMINGIKNAAGALVSAAKGVVGNAINAAKSLLKIHSPSRVFRDIGMYTMMGMTNGISDEGRGTIRQTARMAQGVIDAFNPQLSAPNMPISDISSNLRSAQSQIGTQLQNNVNVQAQPTQLTIRIEGDRELFRVYANEQNAIEDSLRF